MGQRSSNMSAEEAVPAVEEAAPAAEEAAPAAEEAAPAAEESGAVLLPACVTPSRYDIALDTDFDAFTSAGDETITVEVSAATKEISVHALQISIQSASYCAEGGAAVSPELIIFNTKLQTITFRFEDELAVGSGKLQINFSGILHGEMAGYYRSSYTNMNGDSKFMGTTQFEALDARRAFPCWDEPARKAVFAITLTVPIALSAVSNMPELESGAVSSTKRRFRFSDTPIMSTYLVAWCVGEFDFIQDQSSRGVVVRVYTPPGKMAQGRFALDIACKTLDFYEEYFGIEYPLAKLDMIAITEFAAGAMENWGLVTYRVVDLLIDADTASSKQKQRVCEVVAHELAHQWFGNLVTMNWWDDLWLNEGFAAWMQKFASTHLFGDWGMWEQFVYDDQQAALGLDAKRSWHPIQVPIKHAKEVNEVFDLISYKKGASVIRMIHAILGADTFQQGLSAYLSKHGYGNTVTGDLWSAWDEAQAAAGEVVVSVSEAMSGWTSQMGFPLVSIKSEEVGMETTEITLEQNWFVADGSASNEEEAARMWCFPLFILTATGTEMVWFKERELKITVPCGGWFKLNAGQHVPCRVAYSKDQLQQLKSAIKEKALPLAEDRVGLLSDCYALCKAKMLDLGDLMELMAEFAEEESYVVWAEIEQQILGADQVLRSGYTQYPGFAKFVQALVVDASAKCGWDEKPEDGHLDKLLRSVLVRLQCRFPSQTTMAEASKRFQAFLADASYKGLPTDYRAAVFTIMLRESGPQQGQVVYQDLMKVFNRSENQPEKLLVMSALGVGASKELKDRALNFVLSGEVKMQDIMYAVRSVGASGPGGAQLAWEWFQTNQEELHSRTGAALSIYTHVITACSGFFVTEEKVAGVEAYFVANPQPSAARKISQNLEGMKANVEWLAHILPGKLSQEGFFDFLVGLYLDKAEVRPRAESNANEMDDLLG